MRQLLECLLDDGHLDEFQADYAKEMITGHARIRGIQVGVIANHRGMVRIRRRQAAAIWRHRLHRVGGEGRVLYRDLQSPSNAAAVRAGCFRFHGRARSRTLRHHSRRRAFVEAMATATVPKIVLTVNHASGAGYYAMAGQGFDPDFIFSWPTGRMGVMEGDSAVQAVFGSQLEKLKEE